MPERIGIVGINRVDRLLQSLDIISRYPERFAVEVLVAGNNIDLLIQQALSFSLIR